MEYWTHEEALAKAIHVVEIYRRQYNLPRTKAIIRKGPYGWGFVMNYNPREQTR